jgi:hypothetical protein
MLTNKKLHTRLFVFLILLFLLSSCIQSESNSQKTAMTALVSTVNASATETSLTIKTQIVELFPTISIVPKFDDGLISGIPCAAPCFLNITPGKTSVDELTAILKSNENLSSCSETPKREGMDYSLKCSSDLYIDHDGKLVTLIYFYPYLDVTLNQVIEKYGEPDFVFLMIGGTNETTIIKGSYFSKQQMELHFPIYNMTSEDININNKDFNPNMVVEWVEYLPYPEILNQIQDECTLPWHGYGEYEINPDC